MEFLKATELSFDPRQQMGTIFAEGFYSHGLKAISKDKNKLADALAHSFTLDKFYIAAENDVILGFAACTNGKAPIKLDKRVLIQKLGFIAGRIAFWALNKFMVNHAYPFEISDTTGVIEFVATASEHRGKGVAGKLIAHIMEVNQKKDYILEVADSNAPAIRVYERLKFTEFKRIPAPKGVEFNHLVYMRTMTK